MGKSWDAERQTGSRELAPPSDHQAGLRRGAKSRRGPLPTLENGRAESPGTVLNKRQEDVVLLEGLK